MFRLLRPRLCAPPSTTVHRALSTTPPHLLKSMPPRPPLLPEDSFTEAFLCGTGPGGQKINKTSSAVQLKHLATGLVLKVQATRSRSQNRKIAREMLALRVQDLECKEKRREGERVKEMALEAAKESREGGGERGVVEVVEKKKKAEKKGTGWEGKSRLEVVTETKVKRKMSGEKKRKRKYKALAEEKERALNEARESVEEKLS